MKTHLSSMIFVALLLLTACNQPTVTPPSSATPVPIPTSSPTRPATAVPVPTVTNSPTRPATTVPVSTATSSPAPTVPTATPGVPTADSRLPAPLYLLQAGQIARIERDTTTRKVLTAEHVANSMSGVDPIAEFAVSPSGGLAYIVGDRDQDRLVLTDAQGQGARTIYAQQGHELSDLVFTPDGQALMLHLLDNRQPPDLPSGLYRLPVAGGTPMLVHADDPLDDPVNPSRAVSGYRPVAFSPDGTRLLLQIYALAYGEICGVGVIAATGGDVTRVSLPADLAGYCGEETWTADGTAVLLLGGKATGDDAGPRLWRAELATGTVVPFVAEGTFARQPHGVAGGATRFFLSRLIRDASGAITGATFAPVQVDAPGTPPVELDTPFDVRLNHALWAPNGAGVLIDVDSTDGSTTLRWLRLGAPSVDLPGAEVAVRQWAWGTP